MIKSVTMFNQLKLLGIFALTVVGVESQSSVMLVADPSSVWVGHTDRLSLNCSFSHQTSDFSALTFLVLAKTDTASSNNYKELATVPGSGASHSMDVTIDLGARVTGQLHPQGSSFIAFEWTQPQDVVMGKYRCEAHGMSMTGQPISATALAVVDGKVTTIGEPGDFDILVDMIQHVNNSLQDDTKYLENELKQWLHNHTTILSEQAKQINIQLAAITSLQKLTNNQTTQVFNNDTAQLNDIKAQLVSLKNDLLNQTSLQTIRVNDLQKQLVNYKAEIDGQTLNIANQTTKIHSLETLLHQNDVLLSNQTAQINDLSSQLQGLLGLSSNQTSIQGAQLADLQSQINSNKDKCDIQKNIVDAHNLTLVLQKQQLDTQNLQINTLNRMLNNLTQQLQDQSALLGKYNYLLDDLYTRINNSKEAIFQSSFTFGKHTYYLTKPFWRNIPMAESLCQLHGGYLVEIDDLPEMTAVTNHLNNQSVTGRVFVGGTDVDGEGVWKYARTGTSMSFFDWAAGFPSSSLFENCITLDMMQGWKMEDTKCQSEEWDRFVCEV